MKMRSNTFSTLMLIVFYLTHRVLWVVASQIGGSSTSSPSPFESSSSPSSLLSSSSSPSSSQSSLLSSSPLLSRLSLPSVGDRRCSFSTSFDGWRCSSGECIPMEWVCDNEPQCPSPDDSDEKDGCNMFPQTGCKSWHGRRHVQCPGAVKVCVPDLSECSQSVEDDPKNEEVRSEDSYDASSPSYCLTSSGAKGWRCHSGLCIPLRSACDTLTDCDDHSDESAGCSIFGHSCNSWEGTKHVLCTTNRNLCTQPQYNVGGQCRRCEEVDQWRCDDGRCIGAHRVQDGIRDCLDGSDEVQYFIRWQMLVTLTAFFGLFGLGLSFLYRLLDAKNLEVFSCQSCRALTNTPSKPASSASLSSKSLPDELLELLEAEENWQKQALLHSHHAKGRHLYTVAHQTPFLIRNLYRYLANRVFLPSQFSRIAHQLVRWEHELHHEDPKEALACLRLHLGSSDVLRQVLDAVVLPPTIMQRFYDFYMPVKNFARRQRLRVFTGEAGKLSESLYATFNTLVYSIRPFIGICFFYFEILKNLLLLLMILRTTIEMSRGNYAPSLYPFETALATSLIISLLLSLLLCALVSVVYSNTVFETCKHCPKIRSRLLALATAPLMPAFILANHVYYLQREYWLIRTLQTTEASMKESRLSLFAQIERTFFRVQLHRRIFSFYRVVLAALSSFTVVVALLLIVSVHVVTRHEEHNNLDDTSLISDNHLLMKLNVSQVSGDQVKLIDGLTEKIGDFLGLSHAVRRSRSGDFMSFDNLLSNLDVARDVVFIVSVLYSFLMITTALVRYITQCKNISISMGGQVFLGLYFSLQVASKIAVFVAVITTSVPENATITLVPATFLCALLFIGHAAALLWFETNFNRDFRKAPIIPRLCHLLVNTLAVTPFSPWDAISVHRRHVSRIKKDDKKSKKSNVMGLPPLMMGVFGLKRALIELWWQRPQYKIVDVDQAIELLPKHLADIDRNVIATTLNQLDENGLINKNGLYVPVRTKREFFWLLIIRGLFSSLFLLIEIVNGGIQLRSGSVYYAIDVRLIGLAVSLLCLLIYYKRFHVMHDLIPTSCSALLAALPVVCCLRDEPPLKAVPDEEKIRAYSVYSEEDRRDGSGDHNNVRPSVMTQTSFVGENLGPEAIIAITRGEQDALLMDIIEKDEEEKNVVEDNGPNGTLISTTAV